MKKKLKMNKVIFIPFHKEDIHPFRFEKYNH